MIAMEAGHICQNLYLASVAIGAGTCAIGAFPQDEIDNLLAVDGNEEFAVYLARVGKIS
jgi:nitroreductase